MVPEISSMTNFFVILDHFCPFNPLTTQKIKILKKWKNCQKISSFYTNVPKTMIICYTVPEIRCVTDVILIFCFGYFLPFYCPNNPKTQNFTKMEKTSGDIIILHMHTKNNDHMISGSWNIVFDRRTDGRTEKVTYRDGCPNLKLKSIFYNSNFLGISAFLFEFES